MSEITIALPYSLNTDALRGVVQDFINRCGETLPAQVILDFHFLGFIEPAGITFLSNFVYWLHHKSIKCGFVNYNRPAACIAFLDDSLFFEQHLGKKVYPYSSPRGTTQHLRRVEHSESHSFIQMKLTPWLASTLGISKASLHPFQACLSEIFINIQDHSSRENGSIFAQHFPNLKRVKIAIADFGVGIPSNVEKVVRGLTDNQAIAKAVEVDFSTRSTPRNRGIGLDFLLQTVVCMNGGEVTISSFNGMVRFSPWEGGYQIIPSQVPGFCPGTTIDIVLRTDTITFVDDEPEDLAW